MCFVKVRTGAKGVISTLKVVVKAFSEIIVVAHEPLASQRRFVKEPLVYCDKNSMTKRL